MPIQIIITGNDAQEAMGHMASFIGMRGLDPREPQVGEAQIDKTVNGANGEVSGEAAAKAPPKRTRTTKPKEPEPEVEEPAGEAEADDADEAEQAKTQPVQGKPAGDDVRNAMNRYVEVYGIEHCQVDVAEIFKRRFPDGSVQKVSDIPEDWRPRITQDIRDMTDKNPFKRQKLS